MSSNAEGTGRIHAELKVADGEGEIRLEAAVDAGVEDLWSALTDPGRLHHWLGDVHGDLELGGSYQAHYFASGWEGVGRIEVWEPCRRLRVVTHEAEAPGEHAMEVMLEPVAGGSRVAIHQWGVPPKQLDAYGAGLQVHVEDLIAHLAGQERCDAGVRWDELQPGYAELAQGLA